ncbi:MAG: S1C family serine protease [Peptostreptococcaceae bacterium]
MSNFDDYRDCKAKITFNKVKKKRRGKIVVITVFCLFIASLGGVITAFVMIQSEENENYYIQGDDNIDSDVEMNKTDLELYATTERVSKSVVSVIKIVTDDKCTMESNVGVGIVAENGEYIITNYYGIEDASSVKVKLYNDVVQNVSIIGFDSVYNIAMLKVEGEPLTPIIIAKNSTKIEDGDRVISVGNPLGKSFDENIEVTTMINTRENIVFKNKITKVSESLKMLKTSNKQKQINTGAALCNFDGELIGVNNTSMYYNDVFLDNSLYISIEDLEPIIDGILDKQDSLINQMGVYGEEAVSQREDGIEGVYVKEVTRNGIAYEAGIRPTDIIVKVNNLSVRTVSEINSIVSNFNSGDTIEYAVFKNGKYNYFNIKITEQIQK